MRTRVSTILLLVLCMLTMACSRSNKSDQSSNPQNDSSVAQQPANPNPSSSTTPTPVPQAPAEQPAAMEKPSTQAASAPASTKAAPAARTTTRTSPAPTQAATPAPPKPVTVVVPTGTVLAVRLDAPLSTKTNKSGDPFTATVSQPVVIEGTTAIPRGARVSGVVSQAASAGRIKGGAQLALQLTQVSVSGSRYPMEAALSTTSKGRGKRTAVAAGGGAGVGALIGGIAGGGKGAGIGALAGGALGTAGGAMTGERDIEYPAEQSLSFSLSSPLRITLTPRTNAPSSESPTSE